MRQRIFISAVTGEFTSARDLVAKTLLSLGYEPVWQDLFATEPGVLCQMLRDKIDTCDGLIQLVGDSYGSEPPQPHAEFGRVSYTQYEFLYARRAGKKTWLIVMDPVCSRDHQATELDLPPDTEHAARDEAALAYQAERQQLQRDYRERLRADGEIRHKAGSDDRLALQIHKLKDELGQLRRGFRNWQKSVVAALGILILLVGMIFWKLQRQPPNFDKVDPDVLRVQLERFINERHETTLNEIEKIDPWRQRAEAKKLAVETREQNLKQVAEAIRSITNTMLSGKPSPEFIELSRILQKEGAAEALLYISEMQKPILDQVDRIQAEKIKVVKNFDDEARRQMQTLLPGLFLNRTAGKYAEAAELGETLLSHDSKWDELLHELFLTEGAWGAQSETVAAATQHYEKAQSWARRAADLPTAGKLAQVDLALSYGLLGEVHQRAGLLPEAEEMFLKQLEIRQQLAVIAPNDYLAQHELVIPFLVLGKLKMRMADLPAAQEFYQQALEIAENSAEADPRDLADLYRELGDLSMRFGELPSAVEFYSRDLGYCERLAASKPNDGDTMRRLSISYERMGTVKLQLDELPDSRDFYASALALRQQLADADPRDAQAQDDLAVAYQKLGDVSRRTGLLAARPNGDLGIEDLASARESYRHGLKIAERLATDPSDSDAQRGLATFYHKLGDVSKLLRDFNAAKIYFQKCHSIQHSLVANAPSDVRAQRDLAITFGDLGDVSRDLSDLPAAREDYHRCRDILKRLAAAAPDDAEAQCDLVNTIVRLGEVNAKEKNSREAIAEFKAGLALLNGMIARGQFVELCGEQKKFIEARLRYLRSQGSELSGDPCIECRSRGEASLRLGNLPDAREHFQRGLEIAKKRVEADPNDEEAQRDLASFCHDLADVSLQSGDLATARELCEQSLEMRKQLTEPSNLESVRDFAISVDQLGELAMRSNEMPAAAELYKLELEICEKLALHATPDSEDRAQRDLRRARAASGHLFAKVQETRDAILHFQYAETIAERGLERDPNFLDHYDLASHRSLQLYLFNLQHSESSGQDQELHRLQKAALDSMKSLIDDGYRNFEGIRQDADFSALVALPEFESLVIDK